MSNDVSAGFCATAPIVPAGLHKIKAYLHFTMPRSGNRKGRDITEIWKRYHHLNCSLQDVVLEFSIKHPSSLVLANEEERERELEWGKGELEE